MMLELDPSTVGHVAGADHLDPAALRVLRELDPTGRAGLLQRILGTFLSSLDQFEVQYRDALARQEWSVIEHVAHTLKSSSASVGAMALSRRCAEIEQDLRQGRVAQIGTRLPAFEAEMTRARLAVQRQQEAAR